MSDLVNIMRDNRDYETSVSPQMLVSCSLNKKTDGTGLELFGCGGGDPRDAAKWLQDPNHALLPESCMPYTANNFLTDGKTYCDAAAGDTTNPMKVCYDIDGGKQIPADMSQIDKVWVKDFAEIGTWFE